MKKTILFLFVALSGFTYAQDNASVKIPKTKRFFLGVNFSPDLCYRTLKNSNGATFFNSLMAADNKSETYKLGFTSGVNACYLLTKHINLELGVQYSNKGYQTKETPLIYSNSGSGVVYNPTNSPISGKMVYTYSYLDIPLKVNFVFGKSKTQFVTGVGLTTDILLKASNIFKGETEAGNSARNSSTVTNNFNKVNLSPTISCGIQYRISEKMFFKVEPTFRYGLLKMATAPITQYVWNAGLNVSWYFL